MGGSLAQGHPSVYAALRGVHDRRSGSALFATTASVAVSEAAEQMQTAGTWRDSRTPLSAAFGEDSAGVPRPYRMRGSKTRAREPTVAERPLSLCVPSRF